MNSERERTGREYTGTRLEWREPGTFPELSLAALIVSLLRSFTISAAGES